MSDFPGENAKMEERRIENKRREAGEDRPHENADSIDTVHDNNCHHGDHFGNGSTQIAVAAAGLGFDPGDSSEDPQPFS